MRSGLHAGWSRLLLGMAGAAVLLSACTPDTAPTDARRDRAADRQPQLAEAVAPPAIVVVGTGNPAADVPAVQAAVDQGGTVVLEGHFSFDAPPTKALPPRFQAGGYPPAAQVSITRAVTISGGGDADDEAGDDEEDGEGATIDGGTIPFYVDAPGAAVVIRGLRFVRPTSEAILVYAAGGLHVSGSRIQGLRPFANLGDGIAIDTYVTDVPKPSIPGHPENVSGRIVIARNIIDLAGSTPRDNTLGIRIFGVGVPGAEVRADVVGNVIRNATEPAINFRRLVGTARVERNRIATGSVAGPAARPQVIRVVNSGSYVIAHNVIECAWAVPDAQGIGVFSQFAAWPIEHAVVANNEIVMSAPAATSFTPFSAGVGVYGFANDNTVRHNIIRGRAAAGLAIPMFPLPPQAPATPRGNAFLENRFVGFTPSVADIFVGPHALMTRIVGPGTIKDLGDRTIVQPREASHGG